MFTALVSEAPGIADIEKAAQAGLFKVMHPAGYRRNAP